VVNPPSRLSWVKAVKDLRCVSFASIVDMRHTRTSCGLRWHPKLFFLFFVQLNALRLPYNSPLYNPCNPPILYVDRSSALRLAADWSRAHSRPSFHPSNKDFLASAEPLPR
jgi:hypothetical protein